MSLLFAQRMESIRKDVGYLSPSRILYEILKEPRIYNRDYTYVILGKSGPTGKTWMWDKLRSRGLRAIEISEHIYDLVEYSDSDNHCLIDEHTQVVTIVLNRWLR